MTLKDKIKEIDIAMESDSYNDKTKNKKLLEVRRKVLLKGDKAFSKLSKL